MQVYFDNASTTPLREEVIAVMHESLRDTFGNPSSTHGFGRTARTQIETARKSIAAHFNAHPQEIIFTSGGTESDNMLLRCAVEDLGVKTIISSKIEHHAIIHALDFLVTKGCKIIYIPVDHHGQLDYDALDMALAKDDSKKLVTLMHINNEIGTILDLARVAASCQKHKALFHSDAVQGVGHYEIDLAEIKIDFLSAAAHKFHGPKGVGFSFIRKNSNLNPFILGGGQERGLRAGTESVHNIVGMAKALELSYANLATEKEYILGLKKHLIQGLKNIFPSLHLNGCCGDLAKSTYTLINVCLPVPAEKAGLLDFHLDLKGIACSKGSACQAGSNIGSHVLDEVVPTEIKKHPSIRFSFSRYNTKEEVDYLLEVLAAFALTSVAS
jgi:cysteine desulfurase